MFNKDNKLYKELLLIDSSIEQVYKDVETELYNFDSGLIQTWEREGFNRNISTYFIYYLVPLYELLRHEKKENVTQCLVIQLMCCIVWRSFDNCVDEHLPVKEAHHKSIISNLYLYKYLQSKCSDDLSDVLMHHHDVMTQSAFIETQKGIPIDDIWKRCSIFLFTPISIAQLSEYSVNLFKMYINYNGLSHDIQDFLNDFSNKTISLPVYWMNNMNPENVLSVKVVEDLYTKAKTHVIPIEKVLFSNDVKSNFPLFSHILTVFWNIFNTH